MGLETYTVIADCILAALLSVFLGRLWARLRLPGLVLGISGSLLLSIGWAIGLAGLSEASALILGEGFALMIAGLMLLVMRRAALAWMLYSHGALIAYLYSTVLGSPPRGYAEFFLGYIGMISASATYMWYWSISGSLPDLLVSISLAMAGLSFFTDFAMLYKGLEDKLWIPNSFVALSLAILLTVFYMAAKSGEVKKEKMRP